MSGPYFNTSTETTVLEADISPSRLLVLGIIYSVLGISGIAGNSLTLLCIVVNKRLHTTPNFYIANLAVLDTGISVCVGLAPIYWMLHGEIFPYCRVFGFLTIYNIACSRLLLCFIAINRYVLIVKGLAHYQRWYTRLNIAISIVISYTIPAVIMLPALLNAFSGFTYNDTLGVCFFEPSSRESYWYITGLIETTFFMPALFLTIILYILIIKKFRNAKKKIRSKVGNATMLTTIDENSNSTSDKMTYPLPSPQRLNKQMFTKRFTLSKEKKTVINLVTVFSVFLLCWSPLCFTIMADWYFQVPANVFSALMVLGSSNSAFNFFIYAFMNSQFRRTYARLLLCKYSNRNEAWIE